MLIVRSLPAGAQKAQLGGTNGAPAHYVALCPIRFRKERTDEAIEFLWGDSRKTAAVLLLYQPQDEAAR